MDTTSSSLSEGSYSFSIEVSLADYPEAKGHLPFNVVVPQVTDECVSDELNVTGIIDNFLYYISRGPVNFSLPYQ